MIAINPKLTISLYSKIELTVHFVFWQMGLKTFIFGLMFTPIDILALFDQYNLTQRYCYKASWSSSVAGPIISKIFFGSYECKIGLISELSGQTETEDRCGLVLYEPEIPFLSYYLKNGFSIREDYQELKCMNWYTADYDNDNTDDDDDLMWNYGGQ